MPNQLNVQSDANTTLNGAIVGVNATVRVPNPSIRFTNPGFFITGNYHPAQIDNIKAMWYCSLVSA